MRNPSAGAQTGKLLNTDFRAVELMGGKTKVARLGPGSEFLQGLMCPQAMWTDRGQREVSINQRAPVYWWLLHTNSRTIWLFFQPGVAS